MPSLPPVEKLPLLVRKNLRDEWDAKKESLAAELSGILGSTWNIDINPNALYPYAPEGSYVQESLGSGLVDYVTGAISQLSRFKSNKGDARIADLNAVCHAKTLTMEADQSGAITSNGVDIHEGRLRLLFKPESMNTNIGDCLADDKLDEALNKAPLPESWGSALSVKAKSSLGEYETSMEKSGTAQEISRSVNNPDIKINPNFEDTFKKLNEAQEKGISVFGSAWEETLGPFTFLYISGIASVLKSKGFDSDDLLQEGFNEAVSNSEIVFRIVDSLKADVGSNEVVIEDGVLYVQTTPEKYGSNIDDAAQNIIDLL